MKEAVLAARAGDPRSHEVRSQLEGAFSRVVIV